MHVSCTKLEYVKTAFTKTPRSWSEEVSIQMKACVEPLNQHIKINDGNLPLSSRENVQQMSFIIKELFCLVLGREPYWLKYSADICNCMHAYSNGKNRAARH